jgi:hypothetical protein
LPEVFSLFCIYLQGKDEALWGSILDEDKLKQNLVRATKNKSLNFEKWMNLDGKKGKKTVELPLAFVENLLQVLANLIPNFGSILSPYILSILLVLCLTNDNSPSWDVTGATQKLAQRNLKILSETVELRLNLDPFDVLLDLCEEARFVQSKKILVSLSFFGKNLYAQLTQQIFSDRQKDLFKIIRKGFMSCLSHWEQFSEQDYTAITQSWITVFMKFVVKCSEVVLKKYFNILVKWAKFNEEDYGTTDHDLQKKILFIQSFNAIVENLGSFSINYYGYVYEYYLGFFEDCHSKYATIQKLGQKRRLDQIDLCTTSRIKLHE